MSGLQSELRKQKADQQSSSSTMTPGSDSNTSSTAAAAPVMITTASQEEPQQLYGRSAGATAAYARPVDAVSATKKQLQQHSDKKVRKRCAKKLAGLGMQHASASGHIAAEGVANRQQQAGPKVVVHIHKPPATVPCLQSAPQHSSTRDTQQHQQPVADSELIDKRPSQHASTATEASTNWEQSCQKQPAETLVYGKHAGTVHDANAELQGHVAVLARKAAGSANAVVAVPYKAPASQTQAFLTCPLTKVRLHSFVSISHCGVRLAAVAVWCICQVQFLVSISEHIA